MSALPINPNDCDSVMAVSVLRLIRFFVFHKFTQKSSLPQFLENLLYKLCIITFKSFLA